MTLLDEIREESVTRANEQAASASWLWITAPQLPLTGAGLLPYDLPLPWTRERDRILITTILQESMWAAAVQKAITKQAALGFTLNDSAKSQRRVEIGQTRLLQANAGAGWISFLNQHLLDYLLTDNGAFVELVYKTSDIRSQFLGFMHLDSLRCTRTGDAEIPVLYEDLMGRVHELRSHQVLTFVDMESARAEARGTGMCAASRAYKAIHKLSMLERYVDGKIAGDNPKEIHIVNGIGGDQLAGALGTAAVDRKNKGFVVGGGVAVIPARDMTANIGGYRIPIAEIPDGFEAEGERDNGYLIYANAIGVSPQDIKPLSGQGLGTGTQSVVLDESAEEYGLVSWRKQMEHKNSFAIQPSTTTFSWSNANDIRKKKQEAEVGKARADTRKVQIDAGEITTVEARQMAADAGDIPDVFVQNDQTAQSQLTDNEKPVEEAADGVAPEGTPANVPATKARRLRVSDLDDTAALVAAQKLFAEVRAGAS